MHPLFHFVSFTIRTALLVLLISLVLTKALLSAFFMVYIVVLAIHIGTLNNFLLLFKVELI